MVNRKVSWFLGVGVVCLLSVPAFGQDCPEFAGRVEQTPIMPLGDSITEAQTGHASYRYWLWHELVDVGYEVDFVGSMTGVYGGPPLYPDFDQDHEGHWGWRADQILIYIFGWATTHNPEVVLMHLGHNDVGQGQTIPSTMNDLALIIGELRTANPDIVILLAQVIPCTGYSACALVPSFNAEIVILAATLNTPESPVIAVDHWTGFDPVTDTYDGLHPNEAGEQKMSSRWFATLNTLLDPIGLVFRNGFDSGDTSAWSAVVP